MGNFRMPWFLTIILLCFTFHNFSEAKHHKKLPSAAIIGTVFCDTCFQQDFSKTSHLISGALVAVECGGTSKEPSFHEEVKTNEHGEFEVHLPFTVSKHVKKIKGCSVKLIGSSEPYCAVASTATSSSSLHFKSRNNKGTHIFSAGFFAFKPLKQPTVCNQKPSIHNSREFNSRKFKSSAPIPDDLSFPPPLQDPPMPFLPPIDQGILPPLPQLPTLPPVPGIPNFPPEISHPSRISKAIVEQQKNLRPFPQIPLLPLPPNPFLPPPSILPPNPVQPSPPSFFPPNPLQPPPSILPPNPIQPSPPSLFPPNPIQPSPPSLFPPNPIQPSPPSSIFPPIPGLTPPPPRSGFPCPFPPFPFPFPFPPSPWCPGIPPASTSSKKTSP